jgi:hypothetical protein
MQTTSVIHYLSLLITSSNREYSFYKTQISYSKGWTLDPILVQFNKFHKNFLSAIHSSMQFLKLPTKLRVFPFLHRIFTDKCVVQYYHGRTYLTPCDIGLQYMELCNQDPSGYLRSMVLRHRVNVTCKIHF